MIILVTTVVGRLRSSGLSAILASYWLSEKSSPSSPTLYALLARRRSLTVIGKEQARGVRLRLMFSSMFRFS